MNMFALTAVLPLLLVGVQAVPGGGHFAYGSQQKHCHTKYKVLLEQSCHVEYDEVCHKEFDTVVDTTYVEECQDIVTQQCHQVRQEVHHTSAIVGHNSQVVAGVGGHFGKREAHPGHSDPHNHLQCFSKPHTECHEKPVEDVHEECHVEYDIIVDTANIEECEEVVTTHCEHDSELVKHHSHIVGGESIVVDVNKEGYGGLHKREADAGNQGPQCQAKKEQKCHKKPVENKRKIPHTICKKIVETTVTEHCEETFTTKCFQHHSKYHTSTTIAGQESYKLEDHPAGHGNGHVKRDADAGQVGFSTQPQCHANTVRQCQKKPVQSSHQIPRQVCTPVARQVCVPYEVKVPYEVCGHSYVHREQFAHGGHSYGNL